MSMTDGPGSPGQRPASEQRDRFLLDFEMRLRELSRPAEILHASAEALARQLGADQAAYAEVDDAAGYAVIEREWNNGSMPSNVGRHRIDDFGPAFAADLRAGRTVVIEDVGRDARTSSAEARAAFLRVSVAAFVNLPLVKDGRLEAVVAVHSRQPRGWSDEEVGLAHEVMQRTWDTMVRARAEKRLRESEARQALLLRLTERQRASGNPAAMMQAACEELGIHLEADRVGWFEAADGDAPGRAVGWSAGRLAVPGEAPATAAGAGDRAAAGDAAVVVVEDTRAAGAATDAAFPAGDARALVGVPIVRDGRLQAGLYVHQAEPRAWSGEDVALVRKIAGRTWEAVERARAVAALAASEERLRLALEAGRLGDWELDLETNRALLSRRHDEIFGYTGRTLDWSYEVFLSHVVEEDRARVDGSFKQALAQGVAWTFECRIRRPDGRLRWIEARGEPLHDASGRAVRLLGIVADVTERKASEAALADREARLQAVTDSVDHMIWSTGPQGRVDYCNQRWYDYTGMAQTQPARDGWSALLHPDDAPRVAAAWRRALDEGTPYRIEYRLRRHDGRHRWVLARAEPVRDAAGTVTRWYGSCTDIQEIVEAREVLARSHLELERLVEERTRERDRAWKHSRDLQAVFDGDGVVSAVNDAWTSVLGWPRDEVVGRRYLDLLHPEDPVFAACADGTAPAAQLAVHESRVRHRDGGYRWISWVAAPEGGLVYASGRHVTAEKEAAFELEATREQLRQSQKMEAIGQLTGGLAHDFNNLLGVITTSLEMLRRSLARGRAEDAERFIGASQRAARQAASLTHRLLAFSRRQTFDSKPTDLDRLVAGMEELIRRTVGPAVETVIHADDELWSVLVDRNQMESALLNLCLNARDAMPDGGRLTIRLANETVDERAAAQHDLRPGRYVTLCVIDTGTGMTPAVVARAFDPFFTTKPIGRGTGLGLSMVYGFARQSGGQVRISSEVGAGTTLCVHLPHHGGAEEAPAAEAPSEEAAAAGGETVLLVDDEPDLRLLLVQMLQEMGFRVLAAPDGAEGLRALQSDARIELLITDVGLPGGMNGRQLADAARAHRPGLQVLFITGYADNAVMGGDSLEPGMMLLRKPFARDDLAGRIARLREQRGRPAP